MTDGWEPFWDRLIESLRRVAASLSANCPGMTWSAGHSDNKAFPFRAYATFNRGRPESVDVVVSVDFHRQPGGELRFTVDIGLDNGEVLLDGPSGTVDIANGLLASREEIDRAVMDIINFVDQSAPILRKAMEQEQP